VVNVLHIHFHHLGFCGAHGFMGLGQSPSFFTFCTWGKQVGLGVVADAGFRGMARICCGSDTGKYMLAAPLCPSEKFNSRFFLLGGMAQAEFSDWFILFREDSDLLEQNQCGFEGWQGGPKATSGGLAPITCWPRPGVGRGWSVEMVGDQASRHAGSVAFLIYSKEGWGARRQKTMIIEERGSVTSEWILPMRWILTWKPVDENNEKVDSDKMTKADNKWYKPKARLVIIGYMDPDRHHVDKA